MFCPSISKGKPQLVTFFYLVSLKCDWTIKGRCKYREAGLFLMKWFNTSKLEHVLHETKRALWRNQVGSANEDVVFMFSGVYLLSILQVTRHLRAGKGQKRPSYLSQSVQHWATYHVPQSALKEDSLIIAAMTSKRVTERIGVTPESVARLLEKDLDRYDVRTVVLIS